MTDEAVQGNQSLDATKGDHVVDNAPLQSQDEIAAGYSA